MYLLLSCTTMLALMSSCAKDEIDGFDYDYSSVHFPGAASWESTKYPGFDGTDLIYKTTHSFLSDPFAEGIEFSVAVIVSGEAVDYDRTIAYNILEDGTTALESEYILGDAIVPAGSIEGTIEMTLLNADRLSSQSVTLAIQLDGSDDLMKGPEAYSKANVTWSNTVIEPTYIYSKLLYNAWIESPSSATYYTAIPNYSPAAHKVIIAATGLDDIPTSTEAIYMYLNGYGPYKTYALMIGDYIALHDEEYPDDPLLHDAGDMIGQRIESRKY